jgi:hypothetical protein
VLGGGGLGVVGEGAGVGGGDVEHAADVELEALRRAGGGAGERAGEERAGR